MHVLIFFFWIPGTGIIQKQFSFEWLYVVPTMIEGPKERAFYIRTIDLALMDNIVNKFDIQKIFL